MRAFLLVLLGVVTGCGAPESGRPAAPGTAGSSMAPASPAVCASSLDEPEGAAAHHENVAPSLQTRLSVWRTAGRDARETFVVMVVHTSDVGALRAAGLSLAHDGGGSRVTGRICAGDVARLAAVPGVEWIEAEPEVTTN